MREPACPASVRHTGSGGALTGLAVLHRGQYAHDDRQNHSGGFVMSGSGTSCQEEFYEKSLIRFSSDGANITGTDYISL